MIFETHAQGSPEWLQSRAGVITASRFKDACDTLKSGAPSDKQAKYMWLVIMERIAKSPLEDVFVTWQMKRGTELEPIARAAYEAETGELIEQSGIVLTDDRVFGYSTDGFVGSEGLIEIKCPSACDKLGAIWTSPQDAESEYIDQINGGLWITGRKWCDLVVFCPWLESVGKHLFIKRIFRNDDAIERLESSLLKFAGLVESNGALMRKQAA